MKNCETCKYCFTDDSVGHRECCYYGDMTEEEIVKYAENMEDGCPHWEKDNRSELWMTALEKLARSGREMPKFTT